jgi:hypothetical protein
LPRGLGCRSPGLSRALADTHDKVDQDAVNADNRSPSLRRSLATMVELLAPVWSRLVPARPDGRDSRPDPVMSSRTDKSGWREYLFAVKC